MNHLRVGLNIAMCGLLAASASIALSGGSEPVAIAAPAARATTYPTITEQHCQTYAYGAAVDSITTCVIFYSRRQSDGTGDEWTGAQVYTSLCAAFESDGKGKFNPATATGTYTTFPYVPTDSYNLNGLFACSVYRGFSVMGPDTGQMRAVLDLHARLNNWPDKDLTFDPCLSPSGAC